MESFESFKIKYGKPIDRFITAFNVFDKRIPGGIYKIRIYQTGENSYIGSPNVAARGNDGYPNYICGIADTVTSTLQEAIKYFINSIPMEYYGCPEKFIFENDDEY